MLKHLRKIISAVFLAGLLSAAPAFAADLQAIISSGKVRIGVPIDVPPFGSVDANKEAVGLDVDMAKKIADKGGVVVITEGEALITTYNFGSRN